MRRGTVTVFDARVRSFLLPFRGLNALLVLNSQLTLWDALFRRYTAGRRLSHGDPRCLRFYNGRSSRRPFLRDAPRELTEQRLEDVLPVGEDLLDLAGDKEILG